MECILLQDAHDDNKEVWSLSQSHCALQSYLQPIAYPHPWKCRKSFSIQSQISTYCAPMPYMLDLLLQIADMMEHIEQQCSIKLSYSSSVFFGARYIC